MIWEPWNTSVRELRATRSVARSNAPLIPKAAATAAMAAMVAAVSLIARAVPNMRPALTLSVTSSRTMIPSIPSTANTPSSATNAEAKFQTPKPSGPKMPSKPDRDDQIEAETHNLVPDQPGRIDSEAVLITVLQVRVHIESRIKRNAAPSEGAIGYS